MRYKVRLVLGGLVALIAASAVFSMSASAGPGPFWLQKKVASCGCGVKITAQSPLKFQAKSGRSVLKSKILGLVSEVVCQKDRAGGIIYNNGLQGQAKLAVTFTECTVAGIACTVREPIQFKANAHLMWKWNGLEGQREAQKQEEQAPDLLFYHSEIQQGATELEKQEFVTLVLEGGPCGGELPLTAKGYESADLTPWIMQSNRQTEFVDKAYIGFSPGPHKQHFWNGSSQIGLTTSLALGLEPAEFTSQDEVGPFLNQKNEQELVAVSEN